MRKSLFIVTIIALFLTANAFGGDINTSNKVQSKHTYNGIQPFDAGGPDAYGYTWKDSNEPDGPVYNWIDITTTGIEIPGLSFDDNVGPAPIGFNFNFYGTDFSTFRMCTNGWFSFTDDTIQYDHVELPSTAAPENIIAPFWNDQAYMFGAKAYYYSNNVDTMIISCHNVRPEAGPHSGPFTYQMILTANGEITFQYLELNDFESWATVGIQNAGRDIGLQIAYDEEYLTDGLAITIYPPPAPQVVYFQDFGFNVGDWTGEWGYVSNPRVSPPSSLTDSQNGDYEFNANVEHYMIEDIDLNDYLGARLSMYLYHELEEDADFVYIYASNDEGTTWTVLDSITGDIQEWYQYTTNIDEFACGNLRLRFVLTSDWNNNFDGCYIDDLEVFGTMTDLVSPEVEFTGDLFARENTHYVGTALITDCSEIDTAASYVTFKINESGDWIEIPMAYDSGDEYSFTIDESNYVADDQIYLTITGVDMAGNETTSEEINFGVETSVYEDGEIPSVFSLSQNFPNPFNAQTSINYSIAERSDVTLEVYNILGQNTATLVNENQNAGTYTVNWDASNISSGIYFYKLTAGEREFTKRMSLLK